MSWEPVRLPEIRYRVLRKAGSVPWDEGDGLVVAQTGDAQADDAAVPPAVPWYYAVFSLKEGLASSVPAHSGPHLVPADGAAESSRKLGKLPVRKLAAAGLATLAVGGGAAMLWGHFPALLPALSKGSSSVHPIQKTTPPAPGPQTSTTTPGTPGTQGAQGTAASGPQTSGNPSPTPAPSQQAAAPSQQVSANSGTSPGAAPILPVPVVVPPSKNPSLAGTGHGSASSSGNTGSAGSVLGDSANAASAGHPATAGPGPAISIPANPEVAVIAVGDPLLASPLEDELEKALGGEGIGVVSGSPALDSLRRHRASSPTISEILASLRADGVNAAVIAQVERGGEDRKLSYYGRQDASSSSRVKIFAYLVNGRRALSPSWSDQIEYTTANASTEGQSAAHRAAGDLATAVRNGWGSLRGASRPTP